MKIVQVDLILCVGQEITKGEGETMVRELHNTKISINEKLASDTQFSVFPGATGILFNL